MNAFIKIVLLGVLFIGLPSITQAQEGSDTTTVSYKLYVVVKNDGTQYIGQILRQDAREVLLKTQELGEIIIPKHEIKSISEAEKSGRSWKGGSAAPNRMGTRYFLSTNALPLKKDDSYIKLHYGLFGDAQFAINDNFSMGVMTSYITVPLIATPKVSFKVGEKVHLGAGAMLGWTSFAYPSGWGAFGYGMATFGDYDKNLNLSVGYGAVGGGGNVFSMNTPLMSLGGCLRVGKSAWLILDSYGFVIDDFAVIIAIPGVRWQTKPSVNWEIGAGGVIVDGTTVPVPMISWSKNFK